MGQTVLNGALMSEKLNIKPIAITIIVIGFLFFLKLQFPVFKVTSLAMAKTLMPGDVIVASKFSAIQQDDLCLFTVKTASGDEEVDVLRVVGFPADELQIVNAQLIVNGVPEQNSERWYDYRIYTTAKGLPQKWLHSFIQENYPNREYKATLSLKEKETLLKEVSIKKINKIIHPFNLEGEPSRDNIRLLKVPQKGMTIALDTKELEMYGALIKAYENPTLSVINGMAYLDDQQVKTYTFEKNYFWLMGDNRHGAVDSRSFGFVPEEQVIGKVLTVLYSASE